MKQALALICLLLAATSVSAQVYRHVDENGNVTFTDQPPEGSEQVEIGPTNTAPPPPSNAFPKPPPPSPSKETGADYKVSITAPADETIIPRGPGNFTVSASITPSLQGGHQLQLLMDGAPREEPQSTSSWNLTNVIRGEHSIEVAVVDKKGKQLAKSSPIKVFVFRPSTNDANRGPSPRPPRPTPRGN